MVGSAGIQVSFSLKTLSRGSPCTASLWSQQQATASSRLLERLSTLRVPQLRFTLRPGHHPLASHRGQGARFLELWEAWGLYVGLMGRALWAGHTAVCPAPALPGTDVHHGYLPCSLSTSGCLFLALPTGPAISQTPQRASFLQWRWPLPRSPVPRGRSLQGLYSRGCLPRLPSHFTLPCTWCHPLVALSEQLSQAVAWPLTGLSFRVQASPVSSSKTGTPVSELWCALAQGIPPPRLPWALRVQPQPLPGLPSSQAPPSFLLSCRRSGTGFR